MRPHTIPSMNSLCLAQFASYFYKGYSNNSETSDVQPELLTHDAIELHVHLDTNTDLKSQLPPRIKLVNKHMHQNSTSLKCKLLLNKIELYLNQIQMLFQKHWKH